MAGRVSKTWVSALVLVGLALSLVLAGAAELVSGGLHYSNYWGGRVFAPLAMAIGAFLLLFVVFGWRRLNERPPELRGKAARRARKAEATRFPIDDFDKPWNP